MLDHRLRGARSARRLRGILPAQRLRLRRGGDDAGGFRARRRRRRVPPEHRHAATGRRRVARLCRLASRSRRHAPSRTGRLGGGAPARARRHARASRVLATARSTGRCLLARQSQRCQVAHPEPRRSGTRRDAAGRARSSTGALPSLDAWRRPARLPPARRRAAVWAALDARRGHDTQRARRRAADQRRAGDHDSWRRTDARSRRYVGLLAQVSRALSGAGRRLAGRLRSRAHRGARRRLPDPDTARPFSRAAGGERRARVPDRKARARA